MVNLIETNTVYSHANMPTFSVSRGTYIQLDSLDVKVKSNNDPLAKCELFDAERWPTYEALERNPSIGNMTNHCNLVSVGTVTPSKENVQKKPKPTGWTAHPSFMLDEYMTHDAM